MSGHAGLMATIQPNPTVCPRPVLFLHIPKTAGTSFFLMLQNAFSDSRVRRIQHVDQHIQATIDTIVEAELDEITCVAGHLPIHLFRSCLDRFQPFTVLRDPVDRVLSLFRFLRMQDKSELQRLGLAPDFTLEAFVSSREPEIYGQVNNGMVRMLCGDRRLWDSDYPEFWRAAGDLNPLLSALKNLERMDFGLTEAMPQTLKLVQARWSIPYALNEYRENITERDDARADIAALHHIVTLNTMDLALYERGRALFRERVQALPPDVPAAEANPLAVFAPPWNQEIAVGDIPGRQGFHEFEAIGLSWLQANRVASLNFVGREEPMRLRLHVYSVIDDYPIASIALRVNEQAVSYRISPEDDRWVWLESDYFDARARLNRMSIEAHLFVPAKLLDPQSRDRRRLGVALGSIAWMG
jgi:Sulfotransferase family